MTTLVRSLYESACKNKTFIQAAYEADGDTKPRWYSGEDRKIAYASVYYGWLVGKYGNEWRDHL